MRRPLLIAIFLMLFISCKENRHGVKKNPSTALSLFEQGSDLMMKGFKSEVKGSDSSKMYYEQAIQKFLIAYNKDTSNIQLTIYLPDLYNKLKKFDSASIWKQKLILDSIQVQKQHG